MKCRRCTINDAEPEFVTLGYNTCVRCMLCQWCGRNPVEKDKDGTYRSLRCNKCKCPGCGTANVLELYNPQGTARVRMCFPCYGVKYNVPVCRVCKSAQANAALRGHTKPTICVECIRKTLPNGMKATHYCSFCRNKATHVVQNKVSCKKCAGKRICATQGCSPVTQCRRCTIRQAEDIRIAHLREGLAGDTEYRHEQNEEGECYGDCRACHAIARAPIEFKGEVTFWPPSETPNPPLKMVDRKHNKSNRYLSVEIEVAGLNNPRRKDLLVAVMKKWGGQIVHDGSLPAGGFEINTSPAAGDFFVRHISEVCTAIRDAEGYVTNACGLHVHADARDLTYPDLRKLFLYYQKMEPVFIQMQPATRGLDNTYCRPVGDQLALGVRTLSLPEFYKKAKNATKPIKKHVLEGIYPGYGVERPPRDNHYAREYGEPHYDGMNAHSWVFRGTLENRFHGGTVVARKIVDWATLWGAFVDSSVSMSEKDIASINPREEILRIAPNDRVRAYITARLDSYRNEYKERGVKLV